MPDKHHDDKPQNYKIYDLVSFILIIKSEDEAITVGRNHPNYSYWAGQVNQSMQLDAFDEGLL